MGIEARVSAMWVPSVADLQAVAAGVVVGELDRLDLEWRPVVPPALLEAQGL